VKKNEGFSAIARNRTHPEINVGQVETLHVTSLLALNFKAFVRLLAIIGSTVINFLATVKLASEQW
jgi:hypothetical protein